MASAWRSVSSALAGPDRDGDDFAGDALFLEPDGFFDRDFVEGVHRHLDVVELDARAIALHPDPETGVDDALDRNQNLHAFTRAAFGS